MWITNLFASLSTHERAPCCSAQLNNNATTRNPYHVTVVLGNITHTAVIVMSPLGGVPPQTVQCAAVRCGVVCPHFQISIVAMTTCPTAHSANASSICHPPQQGFLRAHTVHQRKQSRPPAILNRRSSVYEAMHARWRFHCDKPCITATCRYHYTSLAYRRVHTTVPVSHPLR